MNQTMKSKMNKRPAIFLNMCAVILLALMAIFLASCTGGIAAPATPTSPFEDVKIPTFTPTTIVAAQPTATPMPELSEGPLTWSGETRPLLMAHYMPWYQAPKVSGQWGYHWTMNHFSPSQDEDGQWTNFASHYTPLTGLYDSRDEAVLDYQVQMMKLSGIDGVIVDWYGNENFWDYGIAQCQHRRSYSRRSKKPD